MTTSTFMRLRARRKAAGVAIITAIFLLVVVAGLAVAVVSMSTAQHDASVKDLQAQRAYQAAKAGIESKLLEWKLNGKAPAVALVCGSAATSFKPPAASLQDFTVTVAVACDPVPPINGGGPDDAIGNFVVITSTACNQPVNNACPNPAPGPDYVQRQLRAQL
jgi:MSHA biogenesis protein MshP